MGTSPVRGIGRELRATCLVAFTTLARAHASTAKLAPLRTLDESFRRIDERTAGDFHKSGALNLAFGVVHAGQLIWFRGYGVANPTTQAPLDARTAFRLGSITKLFTGLALLQLQAAGLLSLDDPLSRFIPEAAQVIYPGDSKPLITVRELVTHSSGIPCEVEVRPKTEEALLAGLKDMRLDFTPGTDTSYSNYGMALAGLVVARASGESYRAYLQSHIFDPLGMSASVWEAASVAPEHLAVGQQPNASKVGFHLAPIETFGAWEGAAGLYSTVADLARFAALELSAWSETAPESPVLSRAALRGSLAPASLALSRGPFQGVNWSVGTFSDSLGRAMWHGGWVSGYRAAIEIFPDRDLGFIALTSGDFDANAKLLWDTISGAAKDLAFTLPATESARVLEKTPRVVLEKLIALVNAPSAAAVIRAYTPETFAYLSMAKAQTDAAELHAKVGHCGGPPTFLRGQANHVVVSYLCERSPMQIELMASPESDRAFGAWYRTP